MRTKAVTLFFASLVSTTVLGQASPEENWLRYYGRGMAARAKKDYPSFLDNFRQAARLAPHHPQVIYNLARAHALSGDHGEALALLDKFVALGFGQDPSGEADFASLKAAAGWAALVRKLKALGKPVGDSRRAFTIAERDLIPEGVAYDPVRRLFFVGSIHKRKIVSVSERGEVRDFAAEGQDGLWGVLGMGVDAKRRLLWVNSAAGAESGGVKGTSGVFKYDLNTGRLVRKYVLTNKPREHLLNDLAINSRGDVFVTDSETGAIYLISREKDKLEVFVEPGRFIYPNGITLSADEGRLYVADFANELSAIGVRSRAVARLPRPENLAVFGIDGLYFHRGSLVAVQNALGPGRVVRIVLSAAGDRVEGVQVIEAFNPLFQIPTTGALVGDEFYYIANSQLRSLNDRGEITSPGALREVVILKAKLR